jgi:hypothetical protein
MLFCPECGRPLTSESAGEILAKLPSREARPLAGNREPIFGRSLSVLTVLIVGTAFLYLASTFGDFGILSPFIFGAFIVLLGWFLIALMVVLVIRKNHRMSRRS